MISKKLRPVIGNLITGKLGSSTLMDQVGTTSPKTPLGFKIQSPRGLKNYDLGGIGLGIVAALEKSNHVTSKFHGKNSFCSRNFNRSNPIPVTSTGDNNRGDVNNEMGSLEEEEEEEEFTYVTRRNPDKSSYTRVYRDGYGYYDTENRNINRKTNAGGCLFAISPAKFCDFSAYPDVDFLSSCHLCKKNLHGKDIFMYRGEKAFCSMECRYMQIVKDEQNEKCSSKVSRSISSSPCSNDHMFSTGIFAI